MTLHKSIWFLLLLTFYTISCKQSNSDKHKVKKAVAVKRPNRDRLRAKLDTTIVFIGDRLLNHKKWLLKKYLDKYQTDTCGIIAYSNNDLKEKFEGVKNIGDINGDKIADTVFVIPPFNYCDDGYSYTFFDTMLPRLFVDSYCSHPDNLFSIGDIDEDGVSEICIFYSSCASRFKSLIAYSLKAGHWQQIGRCTFDINIMKPDKEKRVRKISKGKFEMLNIVINNFTERPSGDKQWLQFEF